jgi:hypothetical protein
MTERPTAIPSLRRIAPLAAAGCAAVAATIVAGKGRARLRSRREGDPADRRLAQDEMEALATAEGMPEAREA